MKADPEARQHLQGVYRAGEVDDANLMALQIDYENMEESLRNMFHHNGQPTFNEKEDTNRQVHTYKTAMSKFRNHINYVQRENHVLKRQIASLASQAMNGDSHTPHQRLTFAAATQGEMSQLEDIRATCVLLSERIKRMEEQNNLLLMNAEKQRCDYERCLDRVASQVIQTLSYQRRLQMECDALRMQVHHLTGSLTPSIPGSGRSSQSSPNGQPTRGSASDDVFGQYASFAHAPYNVLPSGYPSEPVPSPYSPTFAARCDVSPGVAGAPVANQKLLGAVMHERRGQYTKCLPQYQSIPRDHMHFNGNLMESQYDRQALSPHRIQTAKTPPLHAIPESVEPVSASGQDLTADFRPRLPRSGSEIISGPSSLASASGPQTTAYDDEPVGRISRSRDRQRPVDRNKVVRSRSFDGHSSHLRTPPGRTNRSMSPQKPEQTSPPSYRPGPPLHSVPVGHQAKKMIPKSVKESKPLQQTASRPDIASAKADDPVSSDQAMVHRDRLAAVTQAYRGTKTNIDASATAHTGSVSSLVTHQPSTSLSQESKTPTVRENHAASFSRGGLQRSFRITRSCERREQRKAVDDVWLPRSGGPSESMALRLTNNRHISGTKDCDSSLPPPPPPPPDDETVDVSEEVVDTKSDTQSTSPSRAEDLGSLGYQEISRLDTASHRMSQSLDHLNKNCANSTEGGNEPTCIPVEENYPTFVAHCRHNGEKEFRDTAPHPNIIEEDIGSKSPQASPTQIQAPKSHKKSTKREAPKPPKIPTPTTPDKPKENLAQTESLNPSVSCEALTSPSPDEKDAPRRLSEGTVRELGKRSSRLAAPSQKRRSKETQNPVGDTRAAVSAPVSPDDVSMSNSPSAKSVKSRGSETEHKPSQMENFPKQASKQKADPNPSDEASRSPNIPGRCHARSRRANPNEKPSKSTADSKKISGSESTAKEFLPNDGARNEKKSEAKKKSGNQKSFVDMMKSKFGGKGSGAKKTTEVEDRREEKMPMEAKPSSVIDPRTLSLEPNTFPPENIGKKSSKRTDQDAVGRKLSRPFLSAAIDSRVISVQGVPIPNTETSNRKGFLGRNNSKRSKISRHGAFQNGDHFNNVPYGRVELIPIGAPIPMSTELACNESSIDSSEVLSNRLGHVWPDEHCDKGHGVELTSSSDKKSSDDLSQIRRQMNDYENVVLMSGSQRGSALPKNSASHSYENVVIIKASERNDEPAQPDDLVKAATDEVNSTKLKSSKETVAKHPSPLQKLWTSLSNHSLNKMSGSESGSRVTLQDIGRGLSSSGQFTSERKGSMFASEQQIFEKAYISSVVEAELNFKEKPDPNDEITNGEYPDPEPDDYRHVNGNEEIQYGVLSDYSSQTETGISSTPFDTSENAKITNSGFDSWPSKSASSGIPSESARGGSLDARFRDMKSIQEIEIDGQSFLQKRSMVDSHSSLGSYGYGSGVSGSSTTSSNKSRGRSPQRRNSETTNAKGFSSSDNDLASTPQHSSLQSRYAARRFAPPIGSATPGSRLQKLQGLPRPKIATCAAKVKMGVGSISTTKSVETVNSDSPPESEVPRRLAPLSCNTHVPIAEKPTCAPETAATKNREPRKSGLPTRSATGASGSSRFGVQRTSIPVRHSASRMQQPAS